MSAPTARAQGSAFTYQGNLTGSGGVPANGSYDFQFILADAVTNGSVVGPILTNAPVTVNDGLFTTTLDFGGAPWNSSPRWLQLGVRTNQPPSTNAPPPYVILTPRQPITLAPYSIRAESALALVGTLPDSQLSTNIPQLDQNDVFSQQVTLNNGVGNFNGTLSGTFSGTGTGTFSGSFAGAFTGDGSGATNLNVTNLGGVVQQNFNWQIVQGTAQQAVADNDYLTTNTAPTTLVLPANPPVGTTLRFSGSGAGGWVLSQGAGQSIITGTLGLPAGRTWATNAAFVNTTMRNWQAAAASADGTKLAAVVNNGQIYVSQDAGATWTNRTTLVQAWSSIASSADGTHLAATVNGGDIYTSTNSGLTFGAQDTTNPLAWYSIASSADGIKLVAVVNNGYIYTSTDTGTNWTQRGAIHPYVAVASSADGVKLVAVAKNDKIYTSIDSGLSWTNRTTSPATPAWVAVASSADGTKLVAAAYQGQLYTSGDSGVTWTPRDSVRFWESVASSSDGNSLGAVVNAGQIYTSFDSGQNWTPRDTNQVWIAIACSANANRMVALVQNGYLYNTTAATSVGLGGALIGNQYSSIELQYIGNGQWMPLTFNGTFTSQYRYPRRDGVIRGQKRQRRPCKENSS